MKAKKVCLRLRVPVYHHLVFLSECSDQKSPCSYTLLSFKKKKRPAFIAGQF